MNGIGGSIWNPPHVPVVDLLATDYLASSGFADPTFRKNLLPSHNTLIHHEQPKTAIVTQGGTQAASADLLTVRRFKPPRRIRLHAKLRPYSFRQVLRDRSFDRGVYQLSDNVSFSSVVVPNRARFAGTRKPGHELQDRSGVTRQLEF